MSDERRQHPRLSVRWRVAFADATGKVYHGHSSDISAGGISFLCETQIPEGSTCKAYFLVPNLKHGADHQVEVEVRILQTVLAANLCLFRMSCQFIRVQPQVKSVLEAYIHFRLMASSNV